MHEISRVNEEITGDEVSREVEFLKTGIEEQISAATLELSVEC